MKRVAIIDPEELLPPRFFATEREEAVFGETCRDFDPEELLSASTFFSVKRVAISTLKNSFLNVFFAKDLEEAVLVKRVTISTRKNSFRPPRFFR